MLGFVGLGAGGPNGFFATGLLDTWTVFGLTTPLTFGGPALSNLFLGLAFSFLDGLKSFCFGNLT